MPTLTNSSGNTKHTASTNEEKGNMLAKTFFPAAQPHTEYLPTQEEAEQICKLDPINREQIQRHISKLKPYKAPGPDSVPNIVLIKTADIIINRLYYIYVAMIEKRLYYCPWKHFSTIVLRKPGKTKYNVPKAYRPIALLLRSGVFFTQKK